MGMAAGQARLLSITARLSDNEQKGQSLSFAKQRLADEADQINRVYNEALNATKLTVLTGFNGGEPVYTDISYGLLTEYNKLAGGKQYLVTNQRGKILVTDEIAKAYKAGNGDFNVFINKFGLSQNDVDFALLTDNDEQTGIPKNYQVVHDAWDKYLTSVGLGFSTLEHDIENADESYPKVIFGWDPDISGMDADGNVTPNVGAPYYVQTRTPVELSHATFTNSTVPYFSDVTAYHTELVTAFPASETMGLFPDLAADATLNIIQRTDDEGKPMVNSKGIPVYEISYTNVDSIEKRYEMKVNTAAGEVFEPDYHDGIIDKGESKGHYYQVLIGKINDDGSVSDYANFGPAFGSNSETDKGNQYPAFHDNYYEGYGFPLLVVMDDKGQFYCTDGGCRDGVYAWLGLQKIDVLSDIYTAEENVELGAQYRKNIPLNYEGTTKEQRELYDYAVALTQAYTVYVTNNDDVLGNEVKLPLDAKGDTVKSIADNPENAAKIQYYRNIFNEMQQFGFVTEADMKINMNVSKLGMKDNNWFEQQLRQGKLLLKTYDSSKGKFVNTTYAEDSNIQEVEDDRRIAKAEIDYTQAQEALERKDKKIDLNLKQLDTEHNALQTEYESVKSVVDKNIEKSFNIFS